MGRGSLRTLAVTVLCTLAALDSQSAAAAPVGSWSPAGPTSGLVQGSPSSVTMREGRVLLLTAGQGAMLAAEVYDPASRAWTSAESLPVRTSTGWTAVALPSGGALVIGVPVCSPRGFDCFPTTTAYRFVAGGSTWYTAAAMNVARGRPTAVALADGRVLVAGGFGQPCRIVSASDYSCPPLASAETYDPRSERWSPTGPMPEARGDGVATLMSDKTALLVGGAKSRDALRYDPRLGAWTKLAPTSFGRTRATVITLPGDRAMAFGGDAEAGFYGFRVSMITPRPPRLCEANPEIYSTATNAWIEAPDLPDELFSCSGNAARVSAAKILYEASNGIFQFDARRLCWAVAASNPTNGGSLASLPLEGVLAYGGLALGPPTTASETFAPGSRSCSAALARMQAKLFAQLLPVGHGASVPAVAEHGYSTTFRLPAPGSISIDWYSRPIFKTGSMSPPVLLARGRASSAGGGAVKVTIETTPIGRSDFQERRPMAVRADAEFHPLRGREVKVLRGFMLHPCPPGLFSSGVSCSPANPNA
jgi:hypothetical protein